MTKDFPSYDPNPETPAEQQPSPKKPRRKPMKRRKVKAAVEKPVVKRRKRRVRKAPKAVEQHTGGRFTPEVYRVLGALLNLETPLRNFVIEIAKGVSK